MKNLRSNGSGQETIESVVKEEKKSKVGKFSGKGRF